MAICSRRPLASAGLVALAVLGSGATIAVLLETLLEWLLGDVAARGLRIALTFVGYDIAVGLVLLAAIAFRLAGDHRFRDPRPADRPPLSILIAAYEEEDCIVDTVTRAARVARPVRSALGVGPRRLCPRVGRRRPPRAA